MTKEQIETRILEIETDRVGLIDKLLPDRLALDYKEFNGDDEYDNMLDDCFSFKEVGGIFAYMLPSNVLKECDPTAYRCGKNDWLDSECGETIEYIGSGYWKLGDVEEARDAIGDELDTELAALEAELAELVEEEEEEQAEQEKEDQA